MQTRLSATSCFGIASFLGALLSISHLLHGQFPQPDPVQAVLAWYKAFDGASGTQAQYSGTVGNGPYPLRDAYRLLASELQKRMSRSVFEESYARVARLKLLQAHLTYLDESAREADVFVEEERAVVFERTATSPGIPAIVWYEGTLHLTQTSGTWQIAAFALQPEDIISLEYGGHQPWRGNPTEVAQVAASQSGAETAQPCSSTEPRVDSGIAEVEICGEHKYRVRVVKLHSGQWRVVGIEPPLPGTAVR